MKIDVSTKPQRAETLEILTRLIEERYSDKTGRLSFSPESPQPIRQALESYDFREPRQLKDVLLETTGLMDRWNLDTSHRRYLGLFNGPAHFSSVVADALVAAFNPQLSVWSHSGAANEIEAHCVRFFSTRFGYKPSDSFGHFTSGGSESNMTALLCALNAKFPQFKKTGGLALKQRPVFYVSEYAHHSLKKAASSVGLGTDSLRIIPTDADLKIDPTRFKQMLQTDSQDSSLAPFCVVASAGTTSAGVIDPLVEIAQIAKNWGLWFHVDAAWGGAAAFSERLRPFLAGIELSDSITFDAHKWLSVAMGAGVFLTRHKCVVNQTFDLQAEYMPEEVAGTSDPHKTSLQWSRRFIGLKVFFALAELGLPGLSQQLEHQAEMGDVLRKLLQQNNWILLNPTPLPVVCFTHPMIRQGLLTTQSVLSSLYRMKKHWISETKIGGETVFRACITHPETKAGDLQLLIEDLNSIIKAKQLS